MKTKFFAAILAGAVMAGMSAAGAKETVSLWFWGAPPNLQQALQDALVAPFNASQDQYELKVEFRNSVDNDVRVAVMAGQGPDLIYTSGPSYIGPFAEAGKLEPLDAYVAKFGWDKRLLEPVLNTCKQQGHYYCLPPSLITDGMFYNKAVLEANGWSVPKTKDEVEAIMKAAREKGLYASVTGNKGWQPVNENYASIFINNIVGPKGLYDILSGTAPWDSPEMRAAIDESARWFQAGYLGGKDYFSLNFDQSISLLHQGKAPFFFAPSIAFQWATNYFKGDEAGNFAFAPFPQMAADKPYPVYDIGVAFTLSINANSKVKDGAAAVLDMIFSPEFVQRLSPNWPGYWAIPLKDFPLDDKATGITKSYYDAMKNITGAVATGSFGYKIQTFFPPATSQIFVEDLESVWLKQETAEEMLEKAEKTYAREKAKGLVQEIPAPSL